MFVRSHVLLFRWCKNNQNLKGTKGDIVPVGMMCLILAEDENGIIWDLVEEIEFGPSKR